MTQIGESGTSALSGEGKQKCVFCDQDHQDEPKAPAHSFARDMPKLKSEGRQETIKLGRSGRYPADNWPPLVEWEREITNGYKAAAHHCIALCSVNAHRISGELHQAGYDPNNGSNCIWLPYSDLQFVRARAYSKPLQKHRGGHTDAYFSMVDRRLDYISSKIAAKFCNDNTKIDKELLLKYVKIEENVIWLGIASAKNPVYYLYNKSFLSPSSDWGTYEKELNITKPQFLKTETTEQEAVLDQMEEKESINDPEKG